MNQSDERFELPQSIDEKLRRVQGRLSTVGWTTAGVLGVAALLGAMLVAMLVDYLATLYDSSWRSVLTFTALGLSSVVLVGWAVVAWRRWRRLSIVAQEVDRRAPQLEERWSIVTQHAETASGSNAAHPAVLQRVANEAAQRGAGVEPGEVVSLNGLVRAFLVLNAVTVVLLLAAVLDWQQTNVLVRRFWSPGANISATRIALEPGDVVVGRGEPLTLAVSLSGKPVEKARLAILSPDDEKRNVTLVPRRRDADGPLTASHRMRRVDESFTYRVRAGDGQTEWNDVTVADRPSIAAAQITITPPEYRHEQPKTIGSMPRRVSVVEGTLVELAVQPRGDVESFKLMTGKGAYEILTPDADGWYRWQGTPTKTMSLSPVLTEPHGLTNRRPPVTQVRVYPDRPPVVRVITPDDAVAVTPDDTVEITFVAKDDNGVASAELVVYKQPEPIEHSVFGSVVPSQPVVVERIPIDLGDNAGDKQVTGKTELDLGKYALEDGASLSYEVRVTERRSPPGATPNPSTSSAVASDTTPPSGDAPPTAVADASDAAPTNPSSNRPANGEAASPDGDPPTTIAQADRSADQPRAANGADASTSPTSPKTTSGANEGIAANARTNDSPAKQENGLASDGTAQAGGQASASESENDNKRTIVADANAGQDAQSNGNAASVQTTAESAAESTMASNAASPRNADASTTAAEDQPGASASSVASQTAKSDAEASSTNNESPANSSVAKAGSATGNAEKPDAASQGSGAEKAIAQSDAENPSTDGDGDRDALNDAKQADTKLANADEKPPTATSPVSGMPTLPVPELPVPGLPIATAPTADPSSRKAETTNGASPANPTQGIASNNSAAQSNSAAQNNATSKSDQPATQSGGGTRSAMASNQQPRAGQGGANRSGARASTNPSEQAQGMASNRSASSQQQSLTASNMQPEEPSQADAAADDLEAPKPNMTKPDANAIAQSMENQPIEPKADAEASADAQIASNEPRPSGENGNQPMTEQPNDEPMRQQNALASSANSNSATTPNGNRTPSGNRQSSPQMANNSQDGQRSSQSSSMQAQSAQAQSMQAQSMQAQSMQAQSAQNPSNRDGDGQNRSDDQRPPGDTMTRRQFDMAQAAQSGTSNSMQVKIDKFAGSFEGQQRRKLEIAIAPSFAKFQAHLQRAEKLTRGVLDQLDTGAAWSPRRHRDVTSAEGDVRKAQRLVADLRDRTRGTPYAFVGLQLGDISATNLTPARESLWTAYQTDAGKRVESVRGGWQQLRRALDRLDQLTKEYESAKQEHALADRSEQIKKMYRVYVEDAMIRLGLQPDGGGGGKHQRKIAEFDLDEEYLERLREVLEMRNKLRAELARILDDDPRLLRRFMNNFRDRADNLGRQITKLREEQEMLARDSGAWADADAGRRDAVLKLLRQLRLDETADMAKKTGDLAERFEAWLPYEPEEGKADPASEARGVVEKIAAHGQELTRAAGIGDTELAVTEAEAMYQALREFEVAMRRLGGNPNIEGIEGFAVRRILDGRAIVTDVSSWLRRMREIQKGEFHRAAAIEQYQLASATDLLAAKLGDIEQRLAGLLQTPNQTLPTAIAEKTRALLAAIDERATPSQLGAAIALQQPDWQRVIARQDAAVSALADAEHAFDEMMAAVVEELDKLPVLDPIASLLRDPTLDEILAQLENEGDLAEELGVPRRRSNLQIIDDWLRPNGGNNGSNGNRGNMLASQIRSEMKRMEKLAERMRREALARARKRNVRPSTKRLAKSPKKTKTAATDWNKLVSELDEGLLQSRDKLPPQEYRSAIKQYYEIVNRQTNEAAEAP